MFFYSIINAEGSLPDFFITPKIKILSLYKAVILFALERNIAITNIVFNTLDGLQLTVKILEIKETLTYTNKQTR